MSFYWHSIISFYFFIVPTTLVQLIIKSCLLDLWNESCFTCFSNAIFLVQSPYHLLLRPLQSPVHCALSSPSFKTSSTLAVKLHLTTIRWVPTNLYYLILKATLWNVISHMGKLASGKTGPLSPKAVFCPLYNVFLKLGSDLGFFGSVGASLLPIGWTLGSLEWSPGHFTICLHGSFRPHSPHHHSRHALGIPVPWWYLMLLKCPCTFMCWCFCLSCFLCL